MLALTVGHAGIAKNLSNLALPLTQIPMDILGLTSKVESGEMSLFEAHQKENDLIQQKHDAEMTEEILKILYEENKKKKKAAIQRNFGSTLG